MNHWTCPVTGCRECGSGYPSDRAATAAARRHAEAFRAYHRTLTIRTEPTR